MTSDLVEPERTIRAEPVTIATGRTPDLVGRMMNILNGDTLVLPTKISVDDRGISYEAIVPQAWQDGLLKGMFDDLSFGFDFDREPRTRLQRVRDWFYFWEPWRRVAAAWLVLRYGSDGDVY